MKHQYSVIKWLIDFSINNRQEAQQKANSVNRLTSIHSIGHLLYLLSRRKQFFLSNRIDSLRLKNKCHQLWVQYSRRTWELKSLSKKKPAGTIKPQKNKKKKIQLCKAKNKGATNQQQSSTINTTCISPSTIQHLPCFTPISQLFPTNKNASWSKLWQKTTKANQFNFSCND